MLGIISKETVPSFNLAAEEYLLKHFHEDIFMLWSSLPSIIVGKHQNARAEVNHAYVRKKGLKVYRRLSGGGTVYHDEGNLNFTFILNGTEGKLVDFRKYAGPVVRFLNELEVPAAFDKRNNIFTGGKKISGNAEHIFKKRVLHHGTLLFSSRLDELNEAIKVIPGKYKDKAVQSVRNQVVNIRDFLKEEMTLPEFRDKLFDYFRKTQPGIRVYDFQPEDIQRITSLQKEKYETWEWNYGYSPNYTIQQKIVFNQQEIHIELVVEKGLIKTLALEGAVLDSAMVQRLVQVLTGARHEEAEISHVLSENRIFTVFGMDAGKFMEALF